MSRNNITQNEELSKLLIYSLDDDAKFDYLLLNGANINYQTNNGWSVMFQAIFSNNNDRLKNVIDLGVDVNQRDKETRNGLFWAIYSNNLTAFKLLASKGVDFNVFEKDMLHAFHYSVYRGRVEFIKVMLDYGVDIDICDNLEANGFLYAVLYKYKDLIEFFSKNGANRYKEDVFGNSAQKLAKKYNIKL
ncbi:hypothetical protein CRV08_00295 [Halarcobacter ebronensis]|uniref:Uncharacterized protein n=1 Tax=Halarcobacter ebronensis TaxID=1462615 RepID=A0A4Q1ANK1_9BACT|nr:ankyrin repeat domain-containing protein [Halarcobacter ebronensis]QKF82253.1 ankyrin domain-containing protein [Halarcobacter ebronensis]RXJ70038.1 hypothetical protein CRV08_00295 [Halarcobacter ebronensis]RXK07713.1 hypothetical protein CRV07_04430 [Halarcobacter ebronensis]